MVLLQTVRMVLTLGAFCRIRDLLIITRPPGWLTASYRVLRMSTDVAVTAIFRPDALGSSARLVLLNSCSDGVWCSANV